MNVELPPMLFYGVGVLLLVFGALRAYYLGWKKRPALPQKGAQAAEGAEGDETLTDEDAQDEGRAEDRSGWARRQGGGYKRNLTFGLLWVGMGIFLILSTFLNAR